MDLLKSTIVMAAILLTSSQAFGAGSHTPELETQITMDADEVLVMKPANYKCTVKTDQGGLISSGNVYVDIEGATDPADAARKAFASMGATKVGQVIRGTVEGKSVLLLDINCKQKRNRR